MKKVLLTGATGFIGKQTIPFLLSQGYEIHALTRNPHFLPASVKAYEADLFNAQQVAKLVSLIKPTHLLHFAWYTTPCKYWSSEENLEWVKSSINLFQEFVANGGKRIVVSGTCAEYEWGPEAPCDEYSTPLKAATLYGACKAALYQVLDAYARQKNISYSWGRIFFLYGPNEYSERLVPSIIQKLLKNEVAPCSHGNQIRDFMHVEDVASAFVALLNSEVQGAVNIASGQNTTLRHVIDAISHKLNAIDKVHYGARPINSEPPIIAANVNRLINEVKWSPKYSLEEGLDQTIAWWQQLDYSNSIK